MVSNDLFNKHTGLSIACPITNTRRDYPFHVSIPEGEDVSGFVMVEQVKSKGVPGTWQVFAVFQAPHP